MKRLLVASLLCAVFLVNVPLLAAVPDAAASVAAAAKTNGLPAPKETSSVTQHRVSIDGQAIQYTATAGTLLLYNDKHQPTASVFYIAYIKNGVRDPGTRPLTFAYNGGRVSPRHWWTSAGSDRGASSGRHRRISAPSSRLTG